MTKRKKGYSKKFRKQTVPRRRNKEGLSIPSNTIRFSGLTKALKDPYNIPYSTLYYYVTKHRSKAGQPNPYLPGKIYLPEPQGVVIIVELYKAKHPLSFTSPPDLVINVPSIRQFASEILSDVKGAITKQRQGQVGKWSKSDDPEEMETDRIKAYSIKFIY